MSEGVKIDFLGIRVNLITKDELAKNILELALSGKRKVITYLNAHCVNVAVADAEYGRMLNLSDIVYPDGMGVVWASLLLGKPLLERANVFDFSNKLFVKIAETKVKLYFLGGKEAVVRRAVENLKNEFPPINVLGFHNGYFTDAQSKEIIREINALKPNVLIVGMGIPKQEKWVFKHLDELEVNLCWLVGGMFDNLSGAINIAPRWVGYVGFEWLYRLFQDPWRMCGRYLIGNPFFIYRVLQCKIRNLFFW
ncbi:MAG: WecB/TagA/CpsF family glycosyltransferase [Candidatus Omnitrophota bacterium]